jgi:hypothetical protein
VILSFSPFAFELSASQGHGHGRSATAMAAYEGQSGSKDRGDPLVSGARIIILFQVC